MSLSSSLYTGVSGLTNLGNGMQVIGDNIANVNTIGYKGSRYIFQDLLSQSISTQAGNSQVGRGMSLGDVSANFSESSTESTGITTDMAIGGEGFFVVSEKSSTEMKYTRAGNFRFDKDGYLTNPEGMVVQGWSLDEDGNDMGTLKNIVLESFSSPPKETEMVTVITNLQSTQKSRADLVANEWIGWDKLRETPQSNPIQTFDYQYSTVVKSYDSLGSTHDTYIYYDKVTENKWEYIISCNPDEDKRNLLAETEGLGLLARGEISFDNNGAVNDITMHQLTGRIGNVTEPESMPPDSTHFTINNLDAVQSNEIKMDGYNFGLEYDALTNEWHFADLDEDGYVVPAAYDKTTAAAISTAAQERAKDAASASADLANASAIKFGELKNQAIQLVSNSTDTSLWSATKASTEASTATEAFNSTAADGSSSSEKFNSSATIASEAKAAAEAAAIQARAANKTAQLVYEKTTDGDDNDIAISFSGIANRLDEVAEAFADSDFKAQLATRSAELAATAYTDAKTAIDQIQTDLSALPTDTPPGPIIDMDNVKRAKELADIATERAAQARIAAEDAKAAADAAKSLVVKFDAAYKTVTLAVANATVVDPADPNYADYNDAITTYTNTVNLLKAFHDPDAAFDVNDPAPAPPDPAGKAAEAERAAKIANDAMLTADTAGMKSTTASTNLYLNANVYITADAAQNAAGKSSVAASAVALDPLDVETSLNAVDLADTANHSALAAIAATKAANQSLNPDTNIAAVAVQEPADTAFAASADSATAADAAVEAATISDAVTTSAQIIYSDEHKIEINLDGDEAGSIDLTINFDSPAQGGDKLKFDINDPDQVHVQNVINQKYSPSTEFGTGTDQGNTTMTIHNHNALSNDDNGIRIKWNTSLGEQGAWEWVVKPNPSKYPNLDPVESLKGNKDKVDIDLSGDGEPDITYSFKDSLTENAYIQFDIEGSTAWKEIEANDDGYLEFRPDFLGGTVESGGDTEMKIAFNIGAKQVGAGDFLNDSMSSTQNAGTSTTIFQNGDGYGAGDLGGVDVDTEGKITGIFSNGQLIPLYRVGLAKFLNNTGLRKEGGTLFSETRESGVAITNKPGTNGLGSIAPSSLEQSNVDLANEFVKMITNQRGFQANSKIVTTIDAMLQEVITMKR